MRTIRYSPGWETCVETTTPLAPRLDEVLEGVEWAVASNAEAYGDEIDGTDLKVALTDPFTDAPALACYFRIENGDYAVMEWFELDTEWVERDDGDDGDEEN